MAVGGGARGLQRGGGGSAGGPRPRSLQKKAHPAKRHTRVRCTGAARALPFPERECGWLRGTAGAGRAGANVRAGGEAGLHSPPMPSANRKRAAGESHSRPTTAWGVPRTPPAIRRLGGRSPVVVAWSSQSSPPASRRGRGKILRCSLDRSLTRAGKFGRANICQGAGWVLAVTRGGGTGKMGVQKL